jgi:hypothetical protein
MCATILGECFVQVFGSGEWIDGFVCTIMGTIMGTIGKRSFVLFRILGADHEGLLWVYFSSDTFYRRAGFDCLRREETQCAEWAGDYQWRAAR